MLSDVFKVALGTTSGPDIALFKRLQSQWMYIDKDKFETANEGLGQEMRSFYADAIYSKVVRRDDYRELLWLCHVFLGGSLDGMSDSRALGAMYQARWMVKAIYSLKMFQFRRQIKLTTHGGCWVEDIITFCFPLLHSFLARGTYCRESTAE